MTLRFLDFDYSEDTEGVGVFDALASTGTQQAAAVHAEIVQVLGWAHEAFGPPGDSVGEGSDWGCDLQGLQEISLPEQLEFDPLQRRLSVRQGPPGAARHTVSLSLSGTPEFCEAFRRVFELG